MKRRVEYWFAMTAICKIGAVAIPTSNMVSHEDITYRVKEADIRCIICADDGNIINSVSKAVNEVKNETGKDVPLHTAELFSCYFFTGNKAMSESGIRESLFFRRNRLYQCFKIIRQRSLKFQSLSAGWLGKGKFPGMKHLAFRRR